MGEVNKTMPVPGDLFELQAWDGHAIVVWHDDWRSNKQLGNVYPGELVMLLQGYDEYEWMKGGVRVLTRFGLGRVLNNRVPYVIERLK